MSKFRELVEKVLHEIMSPDDQGFWDEVRKNTEEQRELDALPFIRQPKQEIKKYQKPEHSKTYFKYKDIYDRLKYQYENADGYGEQRQIREDLAAFKKEINYLYKKYRLSEKDYNELMSLFNSIY